MSVVASVKHASFCYHHACTPLRSQNPFPGCAEHTYEITFARCGHVAILQSTGLPPEVGTTFPCLQCAGYRLQIKVPVKEKAPS